MTVDRYTETKISVDTKPCPYCGGEGIVGCSYVDLWERMCDWFVECAKCGATNINPTRGYSTEEEAVEAWNTRAESKAFLKEVYEWAFFNMECCDEPEWSLFSGIADTISEYWRKTEFNKLSKDNKYKNNNIAY